MQRYVISSLLVGATIFFGASHHTGAAATSAAVAAPNQSIVNEPVVVYSVNGATLAGTVHRQLTVYNTGFATIAKMDSSIFGGQPIDVQTANIGRDRAMGLLFTLLRAGASELPDQKLIANDVPLKTLTVMRGRPATLASTFSYWLGFGAYSGVDQAVNEFITETFPGL